MNSSVLVEVWTYGFSVGPVQSCKRKAYGSSGTNGWRSGRQAKAIENSAGGIWRLDGGDDSDGTAAQFADEHVNFENPFQEACPRIILSGRQPWFFQIPVTEGDSRHGCNLVHKIGFIGRNNL